MNTTKKIKTENEIETETPLTIPDLLCLIISFTISSSLKELLLTDFVLEKQNELQTLTSSKKISDFHFLQKLGTVNIMFFNCLTKLVDKTFNEIIFSKYKTVGHFSFCTYKRTDISKMFELEAHRENMFYHSILVLLPNIRYLTNKYDKSRNITIGYDEEKEKYRGSVIFNVVDQLTKSFEISSNDLSIIIGSFGAYYSQFALPGHFVYYKLHNNSMYSKYLRFSNIALERLTAFKNDIFKWLLGSIQFFPKEFIDSIEFWEAYKIKSQCLSKNEFLQLLEKIFEISGESWMTKHLEILRYKSYPLFHKKRIEYTSKFKENIIETFEIDTISSLGILMTPQQLVKKIHQQLSEHKTKGVKSISGEIDKAINLTLMNFPYDITAKKEYKIFNKIMERKGNTISNKIMGKMEKCFIKTNE